MRARDLVIDVKEPGLGRLISARINLCADRHRLDCLHHLRAVHQTHSIAVTSTSIQRPLWALAYPVPVRGGYRGANGAGLDVRLAADYRRGARRSGFDHNTVRGSPVTSAEQAITTSMISARG